MKRTCLLLLLLLAGCAGSGQRDWVFRNPTWELTDVVKQGTVDEFSIKVRLQFRVRNPNPVSIRLKSFRVMAYADGIKLGSFRMPNEPLVAARDSEIVKIPFIVQTHATPGASGAVEDPKARFRFVGTSRVVALDARTGKESIVRDRTFPIDFTGTPE